MDSVFSELEKEGVTFLLESYSALDHYFRVRCPSPYYVRTDASLVTLAQLFEQLSFPGLPNVDASVRSDGDRYLFRCVDQLGRSSSYPYTALELLYNTGRDAFWDPGGIYPDLRHETLVRSSAPASAWEAVMEASRLVSRYHYRVPPEAFEPLPDSAAPSLDEQRAVLSDVLTARYPHKGLAVLHRTGFIEGLWPELQSMTRIAQSKEHHPEGDVWEHTLQAMHNRKGAGLRLGLAVLLHDVGKPPARESGSRVRPFHNHAELGATVGASFMRRLGYEESLVAEVCYLIRYHMMPAALARLPLYRTERLMGSPLFPDLLELYRADLVSTFRKPTGYYEACRIYKRFLKNQNNPYARPRLSKPPA